MRAAVAPALMLQPCPLQVVAEQGAIACVDGGAAQVPVCSDTGSRQASINGTSCQQS